MPRIDYLPDGTNTDVQQVVLNNNSSNELGVNTTEYSQNSDPDVLDDYYLDLEALTEAADDEKTKEEMARLATECAGLYSIEECDTEAGTLFQLSVFITGQ